MLSREYGNGMIITSDYGSFPHSLLSTSKTIENGDVWWDLMVIFHGI